MTAILPGATIGILGGGQLGRMMAMAARSLGYRIHVMDPDPSCPARFVVDACFEGDWDDAKVAADLARGSDVVTLEIEQISLACLEAAAQYAPVRPSKALMQIIQDRIVQKDWLRDHGFPVGRYRAIENEADLQESALALGGRCFVKTARGGYDGRGQAKIGFSGRLGPVHEEVHEAWLSLGERPCIAEQALDLEKEISVMVARTPSGQVKSFPSAANHHENQILVWSVIPSSIPMELEQRAQQIALRLAEELKLEGLLAVEMFLTKQGSLLVNELAPRPHNSYHASERACVTSQFEQAVRAVCDLPLGDVSVVQPAAIANLLGDTWLKGEPRFDLALAVPGVRLHLYEKHQPRKGRKMGHLSAIGATPEEAIARVLEAERLL
ncbi:Phosphoribosylaminoimidazole carboxylase ATPase subunit [Acidisarcina polymorpha]|uniref:N5-carboxyaminoimidazole ribonucleotide synthase n=1 Tax=Acidisarcina polymorpha TaxID=2211140 RepID=A0A2Z5G4H2_9BACT|nr:5-(carboxyamino)imidazole ribonucleotide synthase [Acidisarcina polymorpha]AXC13575.1 Phosphoribosylaminoimidazole carboxylase ATPase subunit [Acidisarcina polymorpha]